MMKQIQILYFDDNAIQLEYWRDVLSDAGFFVSAILAQKENIELLKNRLKEEWWQVVVADISLVENDPSNEVGLHLVQQSNPIIPKIILTAYPDWKKANSAKRIVEDSLPVSTHFIYKLERDSENQLVEAVKDVLNNYKPYRINNELVIHSDEGRSSILTSKMSLDGKSWPKAGEEMEDLYRKLFFEKDEIFIEAPVFELGQTIFTPVKYHVAAHLPPRTVLVQCGPREQMKRAEKGHHLLQEYDRSQYPSYLRGKLKETLHFGGLIYQLDYRACHFILFSDLMYASEFNQLQPIVRRLFTQVCPAIALETETQKKTADYLDKFGENEKRQLVGQIERHLKNHLLAAQTYKTDTYRFRIRQADAGTKRVELDEYLPSPKVLFENPELMWPEGEVPVGPVYGQLQANTLLINRDDHHIWLPASPMSGHHYFLQDYVTFEASLILKEASQARDSWGMFHALAAWLSPVRFEEPIPIPSWLNREAPELNRTLKLITEIRQLAGMGYEPDLRSYYGAIFLEALEILRQAAEPTNIRTSPLSEAVYDWTAVALGLIARRLTKWEVCESSDEPGWVRGEIEIDEVNQCVWLPGRQESVHLSQALFLLLKLLDNYKYGVAPYDVLEAELGHNRRNIHQQIARLRAVLEPDKEGVDQKRGNDSLYIRVKWGLGYFYHPDGSAND